MFLFCFSQDTSKFLGHGACTNVSRSVTLAVATRDLAKIRAEVAALLRQMKLNHEDMRGVGIQVSKLEGNTTGQQGAAASAAGAGTREGFAMQDCRTKYVLDFLLVCKLFYP